MGRPKQRIKAGASVSSVNLDALHNLEFFEEVASLVKLGFPLSKILQFIRSRGEWQELTDQQGLNIIEAYRKSLPPGELVRVRLPAAFIEAVEKVSKGLDEIEELERLYKLQMERLSIDFDKEKKIGKLFRTTVFEVKAALEILRSIAQIKMDLGIVERRIGKVDIGVTTHVTADVRQRFPDNPIIANVLADPQKGMRILQVINRVIDLSQSGHGELTQLPQHDEKDGSGKE